MIKITCSTIFLIITMLSAAQTQYQVSFEDRNAHYVDVSIQVNTNGKNFVDFKMPVWTPGSYKLREFSQYVDFCKAQGNSGELAIKKTDKNTWRVNTKGQKEFTFSYKVYAFEISVRQSYCDQFYAFLHGTSIFMYADGYEKQTAKVSFNLPNDWQQIEVALPVENGIYTCVNYDELADSPFAIGNFDITSFTSQGVPHKVVMIGKGNYDLKKINKDFNTICTETGKIIGSNPCKQYVHFIQNVESGGGGLEHANSQTSQMLKWAYTDTEKYKALLALVAHEYFHLWNVKRIRPIELGPFDYNKEVYTNMLWLSEGFTAYYDDLIVKRAGFYSQEEYFKIIASTVNRVENTYGSHVSSVADASFNAWVKTYLANENTNNISISYYSKGMLVALLLDLSIRKLHDNKKSLDDLMRELYQKYYTKQDKGFTEEAFFTTLTLLTNDKLVSQAKEWIYGTQTLPVGSLLNYAGLNLKNHADSTKPYYGFLFKEEGGKTMVTYVELNSAASLAGISVNDEIIALNGIRANANLSNLLKAQKPNTQQQLLVARNGFIQQITIKPTSNTQKDFKLLISEEQNDTHGAIRKGWLN